MSDKNAKNAKNAKKRLKYIKVTDGNLPIELKNKPRITFSYEENAINYCAGVGEFAEYSMQPGGSLGQAVGTYYFVYEDDGDGGPEFNEFGEICP